jgi:hypothetical protein
MFLASGIWGGWGGGGGTGSASCWQWDTRMTTCPGGAGESKACSEHLHHLPHSSVRISELHPPVCTPVSATGMTPCADTGINDFTMLQLSHYAAHLVCSPTAPSDFLNDAFRLWTAALMSTLRASMVWSSPALLLGPHSATAGHRLWGALQARVVGVPWGRGQRQGVTSIRAFSHFLSCCSAGSCSFCAQRSHTAITVQSCHGSHSLRALPLPSSHTTQDLSAKYTKGCINICILSSSTMHGIVSVCGN